MENEEKTISINLAVDELRNKLAKDINESGLPLSIVEMIMKDFYLQVAEMAAAQIRKEKEELQNDND
jgi:hypothetical protein